MNTTAKDQPTVKWGILGCARIAATAMIPAIRDSANGEVLATASRDLQKATEYAQRFDLPRAYGSYEELLHDPEIQAIYVPLPNSLHKPWTIRAAEMGKHVLCEKPIACNAGEAQEMADACQQNHVLLMEAFAHRFHPQLDRAMELIQAGKIGRIVRIASSMSRSAYPAENIRMNRELGGGALMDLGCYCVNTARFLIGAEPARVFATQEIGAHGVDERTTATVYFPGGKLLQFDTNLFLEDRRFEQGCTIYGERGNLYLHQAFTQIDLLRFGRLVDTAIIFTDHTIGAGHTETFSVTAQHQWRLEAEYFAGRILAGGSIDQPAENGIANMRVMDAIVRSARSGLPVAL